MSYQPDIIPSSTTGQELQASIQKELAFRGWSTEDDTVMAEYCLVMLGNRKTPDQISNELSDLIGTDFELSFVEWLFAELSIHYPDPNAAPTSSASNNNNNSTGIRGVASQGRRTSGPGGSAVFGQAMSGVKRERDEPESRSSQRAKYDRPSGSFEGVPAGPRNGGVNGSGTTARGAGGVGNGRNSQQQSQSQQNGSGDKSIFDRIGGPAAQSPGFDNIQGTIDAVTRGAAGGNQMQFNPQAFMDPRILAQAQAQAMAQAYAAMQGQMGWPANGGYGAPAFNPAFSPPGHFNPNGPAGGLGFPMAPPRQQQNPYQQNQFQQQQQFQQNQQNQFQRHPNHQQQQQNSFPVPPPVAASVPLPTKPTDPEICKHGVDCSKPTCPYSHPSPVATKYSGLVLSSEACEKGLACDDLDCDKSHVSASQKRAPIPTPYSSASTPATVRPPPISDPSSIPGAGEKVCKFAASCTRKGCVFLHPWDVRDSASSGGVVCRWAENCTRADCHYTHPPNRVQAYQKPKLNPYAPYASTTYTAPSYNTSKAKPSYSATFNNPNNPAIGVWPTEKALHVSDRLKRFGTTAGTEGGGEGEVERIIPGESKNDDVKVEIDIEASEAIVVPAVVAKVEVVATE